MHAFNIVNSWFIFLKARYMYAMVMTPHVTKKLYIATLNTKRTNIHEYTCLCFCRQDMGESDGPPAKRRIVGGPFSR